MWAGKKGEYWCNFLLSLNREIECFFDIHADGMMKNGLPCVLPKHSNVFSDEYIVLISPMHEVDIIWEQGNMYGFRHILIGNLLSFLSGYKKVSINAEIPPLGHFYLLYPDLQDVDRYYEKVSNQVTRVVLKDNIDLNIKYQVSLLHKMNELFGSHIDWADYNDPIQSKYRYRVHNQAYPVNDALVLHFLLRIFKPKRVIEFGSGYSSAVTLDTCEYFLDKVTLKFIEPYPKLFFSLLKDADRKSVIMIDKKLQDIPLSMFSELQEGDILFIDSTHVSKFGSDVNYLFFNIFLQLKKGVIVYLHDIFYPWEYPKAWIKKGME